MDHPVVQMLLFTCTTRRRAAVTGVVTGDIVDRRYQVDPGISKAHDRDDDVLLCRRRRVVRRVQEVVKGRTAACACH